MTFYDLHCALTSLQAESAENRAMNAFLRKHERVEGRAGGRFAERRGQGKNTAFSLNEVLNKLERFEEKLSAQRDNMSDSRMGTPDAIHRGRSYSVMSSGGHSSSTRWEMDRSLKNARHSRHKGSDSNLTGSDTSASVGRSHHNLRLSTTSVGGASSAASSPRPASLSEIGSGSPPPPPSRHVGCCSDAGSEAGDVRSEVDGSVSEHNDSFSKTEHALRGEVASLRGQVDYLGALLRELAEKQGVTLATPQPAAISPQDAAPPFGLSTTRNLDPEMSSHQVLRRSNTQPLPGWDRANRGTGGDSPTMARFKESGRGILKDPKVRWKKACRFALSATDAAASSTDTSPGTQQAPLQAPPTPGSRASPLESPLEDEEDAGELLKTSKRGQEGRAPSARLPPAAKLPPPTAASTSAASSVEAERRVESSQPPVPHRPPPVQPPATPTVIAVGKAPLTVGEAPLTVERYVGSEGMVLFKM